MPLKKCLLLVILSVSLISLAETQSCLNSNGEPVSWWVILKVPPMIGNSGYGYYDSNTRTGQFQYYNKTVDKQISALTQTLTIINRDKLERIAWNDQKPNNVTSSTRAHSKGVIAYGQASGRGFYIVHSIPKYPAFLEDHTVFLTISSAQQVYGQHIACFSLSLSELNDIAEHLLTIRPLIYQFDVSLRVSTQKLYNLAHQNFPVVKDLFQYYQMRSTNYNLNAIFKNNIVNGSIFEDGLVRWLTPGKIVAETWGRPLQTPWCNNGFEVTNVQKIVLNDAVQWVQSQDHSKWVLSGQNYSCFGDMNRMQSQWKRGGAFYCLQDATLNAAMRKIVKLTDQCARIKMDQQIQMLNNLKFE